MSDSAAPYFVNHDRRNRFPWSLYHRELSRRVARIIGRRRAPHVLVVGCGLEPFVEGGPADAVYYGCDLDDRAIEACAARHPDQRARLAVCPSPLELPALGAFDRAFDVVVAKEVIEHLDEPEPWARALAARVAVGGDLILTTPNYGRGSTLALLERTVLEWVARRDGYSRADIHPSRFDRARLAALELDDGMELVDVQVALTRWTLVGHWHRRAPRSSER